MFRRNLIMLATLCAAFIFTCNAIGQPKPRTKPRMRPATNNAAMNMQSLSTNAVGGTPAAQSGRTGPTARSTGAGTGVTAKPKIVGTAPKFKPRVNHMEEESSERHAGSPGAGATGETEKNVGAKPKTKGPKHPH